MMRSSRLLLQLALFFIAYQVLRVRCNPLVPALYVFGDSVADNGNNNYLKTFAKANYWPYGVDYNNVSTGRFSNGKNGPDFLAQYLQLPMPPPPYLSLNESQRAHITTGINYASGSCGISDSTGSSAGECLSLAKQVKYFTSTVTKDLVKALKSKKKLQKHLRKSIYTFLIGHNDFIPGVRGNDTKNLTPQQLADVLINKVIKHFKTVYVLGGRKFMVTGVSSCEPHVYTPEACHGRYYADKLPQRLQLLQKKLPGFLYSIFDGAVVAKKLRENPKKYGFTHINASCFDMKTNKLCEDRSKYSQFDPLGHQTERSNEVASMDCFNGTACYPLTLFQLAKHL